MPVPLNVPEERPKTPPEASPQSGATPAAAPPRQTTGEQQRRHRLEATLLKTLWRSEAHRRLAESNIIGVLFADLDGKISGANDELLRMLGYTREQLLQRSIHELTPEECREGDSRANEELLSKGVSAPREKALLGLDGKPVPVLVGVALIEGSDQKTIGFVLDLTEQKNAEERARLYSEELKHRNQQLEEDLRMAREIQQALLPQQYPRFRDALRFHHRYIPAGPVGGDFFDVLALSETEAMVVICDVMGHGVQAALVTAMVRTLVEQYKHVKEPGRLLAELNRGLIATFRQTGSRMFVSACCFTLNVQTGKVLYANAGHPSPIRVRPHPEGKARGNATFVKPTPSVGPVMGLIDGCGYTTSEWDLTIGDRFVLFTDGLYEIEEEGPPTFSQESLLGLIADRTRLPMPELFDQLLDEVQRRSVTPQLLDDVCLLGVEVADLF